MPGIGLVEVYDLDLTVGAARLTNLSTRAFVGRGDHALIGGLIVQSLTSRLLLRALGPTLATSGVPNFLLHPHLELHDSNGALLAENDAWRTAPNSNDIAATGLAPSDDREAAILLTNPGVNNFTAVVRGADETTGVALLEAYLMP